jgi:hypothetical protein
VIPPDDDPAFRMTVFDTGNGLLSFYSDDLAETISYMQLLRRTPSTVRWEARYAAEAEVLGRQPPHNYASNHYLRLPLSGPGYRPSSALRAYTLMGGIASG